MMTLYPHWPSTVVSLSTHLRHRQRWPQVTKSHVRRRRRRRRRRSWNKESDVSFGQLELEALPFPSLPFSSDNEPASQQQWGLTFGVDLYVNDPMCVWLKPQTGLLQAPTWKIIIKNDGNDHWWTFNR